MTKLMKAAVVIGMLAGLTGCTLPRCSLLIDLAAGLVTGLPGA
jgi:hypothetical protein